MKPISLMRFNALAGYCRQPQSLYAAEELGWFEHAEERVLGIIIRDRTDGDFGAVVLAKDRQERYRAVHLLPEFQSTARRAKALLRKELERLAMAPDEEYYQGDEEGTPLDFFAPVVGHNRLNANFLLLSEETGFSAARNIIVPMMRWYEDPDGNFIEQFQTAGFDARIWELYLFAAFVEMGYRVDRTHAVPDFSCEGVLGEFVVEAVTVNPTQDKSGNPVPPPPLETQEEMRAFLREYMPIKFGSALTSKLSKRYWERENVAGKALLFAIQDFSFPGSMKMTRSALPIYLYGIDYDWEHDADGNLKILPRMVEKHRWGTKEIPSGFFGLPGAENVSAVLFSNSGTISKFNRMGVIAGFGSPDVLLIRHGLAVDHDPNAAHPRRFRHVVNSPDYQEDWCEGLDVYHNPRAIHSIEPWMIPGAAHHRILPDDQMDSLTPDWQPLGSETQILVRRDEIE